MGKGSFIVPSINVDICIIEEQEDHLVIAIRAPKAMIVSNWPAIAALGECCGVENQKVWSARSDPPTSIRPWRIAALVAVTIVAGWMFHPITLSTQFISAALAHGF